MAIDFPSSPTTNQTVTVGSKTWVYDGAKWNSQLVTSAGPTGPQGASANRNVIINGAFEVNQRGLSSTTGTGYGFDRWLTFNTAGTTTTSSQAFALGSCPVPNFDGGNYIRTAVTGQSGGGDWAAVYQRVENVATGSGQTVTLSFYARAASGTPTIAPTLEQSFGAGGSASVQVKGSPVTITTSWARYSVTVTLPSLSGKTIGAGNYLTVWLFTSAGSGLPAYVTTAMVQNNTFDIWGVQLEVGNTATPFQRNAPSLQAELAACQRYYWRSAGTGAAIYGIGGALNSTTAYITLRHPVSMRANPTSIDYSTLRIRTMNDTVFAVTSATIIGGAVSGECSTIDFRVSSGLTSNTTVEVQANNSTSGYIGLSAEL